MSDPDRPDTTITESAGAAPAQPGVVPLEPPQSETRRPEPARRSATPWIVLVLFLLAAIAAGTFAVGRLHLGQRDARAQLDAMRTALDDLPSLANRIQALEARVAEQRRALDQAEQRTAAELADLTRSVRAFDIDAATSDRDWVLAEAEYLVLAASQRLALEQDVTSALAALTSADLRLGAANHPELIAARERLAADIAALRGVAVPDTVGLALYFAELQTQVDAWPEPATASATPLSAAEPGSPETAAGWRGTLAAMWRDLLALVEVRDVTPNDRLLFDPAQRYLVRETVRLELAAARLAVLHRDTGNLHVALATVLRLLEDYYDVEAPTVRDTLARLRALQGTELRVALPGVGDSLDAIRELRARGGAASVPATQTLAEPSIDPVDEPAIEPPTEAASEPADEPAASDPETETQTDLDGV